MTVQGPLPPAGNVMRVTLKYHAGTGGAGGSRFHLHYGTTGVAVADMQTFINKVGGTWANNMSAMQSVGTSLATATVQDLATDTGAVATWSTGAAGTRTGGEQPVNLAVVVNMKIDRHFRGGKYRLFVLAGVDTDCSDGKTWAPQFVTDFQAAFQTWQFGLLGQYGSFTILNWTGVSYYQHSILNDDPSQWAPRNVPKQRDVPHLDPITGFTISSKIGSQRKRLRAR